MDEDSPREETTSSIVRDDSVDGVNFNQIRRDIESSLNATFDVSKIMQAFQSLVSVVTNQNQEIRKLKDKVTEMEKMEALKDLQYSRQSEFVATLSHKWIESDRKFNALEKLVNRKFHTLDQQVDQQQKMFNDFNGNHNHSRSSHMGMGSESPMDMFNASAFAPGLTKTDLKATNSENSPKLKKAERFNPKLTSLQERYATDVSNEHTPQQSPKPKGKKENVKHSLSEADPTNQSVRGAERDPSPPHSSPPQTSPHSSPPQTSPHSSPPQSSPLANSTPRKGPPEVDGLSQGVAPSQGIPPEVRSPSPRPRADGISVPTQQEDSAWEPQPVQLTDEERDERKTAERGKARVTEERGDRSVVDTSTSREVEVEAEVQGSKVTKGLWKAASDNVIADMQFDALDIVEETAPPSVRKEDGAGVGAANRAAAVEVKSKGESLSSPRPSHSDKEPIIPVAAVASLDTPTPVFAATPTPVFAATPTPVVAAHVSQVAKGAIAPPQAPEVLGDILTKSEPAIEIATTSSSSVADGAKDDNTSRGKKFPRSLGLDPLRRKRMLWELRVRGRFLRAARGFKEESRQHKVDSAVLLNDRLSDLENTAKVLSFRLDAQLKALEMIPDRIKLAMPTKLKQRMEDLDVMCRVAERRGGFTALFDEMKSLSFALEKVKSGQGMRPAVAEEPLNPTAVKISEMLEGLSYDQLKTLTEVADGVKGKSGTQFLKYSPDGLLPESFMTKIRSQVGVISDVSKADASEFQQLRNTVMGLCECAVTQNELKKMLTFNESNYTTMDPLGTRLRNIVLGIMSNSTIGDGKIGGGDDQKVAFAAKVYTDIQSKKLADDYQKKMDALKEALETNKKETATAIDKLGAADMALEDDLKFIQRFVHAPRSQKAKEEGELVEGDEKSENIDGVMSTMKQSAEEQAAELSRMAEALAQLQEEVELRPDATVVKNMVNMIERTFKKQLGDNASGMQASVQSVMKVVEKKADHNEVLRVVQEKIAAMKASMKKDDDEDLNVAGFVKCMSCGHKAPAQRALQHRLLTEHQLEPLSVRSCESDDVSVGSSVSSISNMSTRSDISALMSGAAGLKPLMKQNTPMMPRAHNYPVKRAIAAPEPLYRRARMASAMKEMIKSKETPSAGSPTFTTNTTMLNSMSDDSLLRSKGSLKKSPQKLLLPSVLPTLPSVPGTPGDELYEPPRTPPHSHQSHQPGHQQFSKEVLTTLVKNAKGLNNPT